MSNKLSQLELKRQLEQTIKELRYDTRTDEILDCFITTDPDLSIVKDKVRKLAPKNVSVMILGETGTGKELIAKALHGDREGRFVDINVASLPSELIEAELFGAVKGAYTSCHCDRIGLIELANNGTLFLDEIGEMPIGLQSKLLRILQEGTYRRVGDGADRKVNCRIVTATNKTITELKTGKFFRLDLYHRLSVIVLQLKPLRHRPSKDLELLVKFFAGGHIEIVDKVLVHIKDDCLLDGNVRQVENIVKAMIALEC